MTSPANLSSDSTHYFGEVGGRSVRWPRVTTITGEFFSDFSMVPEDTLKNAQNFGTRMHDMIDLYIKDDLIEEEVHEGLVGTLNAWKKFRSETDLQIFRNEELLYSERYQFAGKTDLVGKLRGKWVVIDLKSRKCIMKSDAVQLAAYGIALQERYGIQAQEFYVLELRMDGNYKLTNVSDHTARSTFLGALAIIRWRLKHGK